MDPQQIDEISGVLILDKPSGPSSHCVVKMIKRRTGARKIGHLGTLDPKASGVLPLAINKATRKADFLSGKEKVYEFTLVLGSSTATDDDAGEVIAESAVPEGAKAEIEAILPRFVGEIMQRPPAYSAVKIRGLRAYALARDGDSPPLEKRAVHIDSLSVIGEGPRGLRLKVECRSGTYVRSLCRDMAEAIGTKGHAADIRRLRSGRFFIDDAISVEGFIASETRWEELIIPLEGLVAAEQV